MSDWFESLDGLLTQARQRLSRGVADRRAAARHPVMATVSPEDWPEARTVVMRAFNPDEMTVEVHTDLHSGKMASLAAHPMAAFHVWDASPRLQMRLRCEVEVLSGEAVRPLWEKVPDVSRQSYGVTPPPGTPVAQGLAYEKLPDPASFAVLRCRIVWLDLVHLGDQHRRAEFARHDGWAGQWLSP